MTDTNPYQTPQSNLQEPQAVQYDVNPNWDIGSIFKEAWQLTSGFKATMWGAILIYMGILFAVSIALGLMSGDSIAMVIISQIIIGLVTYPLGVGFSMLGIKRSVGAATNAFMIFDYYSKAVKIFILYIVMTLLVLVGMVLLILPGIYLIVAYSLALPLMIEKNLGVWEALETSRKTITSQWFSIFGLYLVLIVSLFIASIPFGIGLIWALPFAFVVMGVVYRNLFSVGQNV